MIICGFDTTLRITYEKYDKKMYRKKVLVILKHIMEYIQLLKALVIFFFFLIGIHSMQS